MLKDRFDNPLTTGSVAARDSYVEGIDLLLASGGGVADAFNAALEADPAFVMPRIALARHHQTWGQSKIAREVLAEIPDEPPGLTQQERSHLGATRLLIGGKAAEAYPKIRSHILDYPRDALLAQTCMGVFSLIGFSGQPGRESEQLAFSSALAPHYGDDWWFLAQHAFSQIETGQTAKAEDTITRALEGNPRNAQGAHVRSHLYYEVGETAAGLNYLKDWQQGYDHSGLMNCHLAWHIALWAMVDGDLGTMWQQVDDHILPDSGGPALNVLTDLVALFFRGQLAGVDIDPARWQMLSDYALEKFPKPGLAFADVHAALAHALAGNSDALHVLTEAPRGPAADLVSQLAKCFELVASEDWDTALQTLAPALADHARIGGSRAQRDLLELLNAHVLCQLGRPDEARRGLARQRHMATNGQSVAGL